MPIHELRNLLDKDALMNSITANNARLESAIKELSELGESLPTDNNEFKKTLLKGLRVVLYGLQG